MTDTDPWRRIRVDLSWHKQRFLMVLFSYSKTSQSKEELRQIRLLWQDCRLHQRSCRGFRHMRLARLVHLSRQTVICGRLALFSYLDRQWSVAGLPCSAISTDNDLQRARLIHLSRQTMICGKLALFSYLDRQRSAAGMFVYLSRQTMICSWLALFIYLDRQWSAASSL